MGVAWWLLLSIRCKVFTFYGARPVGLLYALDSIVLFFFVTSVVGTSDRPSSLPLTTGEAVYDTTADYKPFGPRMSAPIRYALRYLVV